MQAVPLIDHDGADDANVYVDVLLGVGGDDRVGWRLRPLLIF